MRGSAAHCDPQCGSRTFRTSRQGGQPMIRTPINRMVFVTVLGAALALCVPVAFSAEPSASGSTATRTGSSQSQPPAKVTEAEGITEYRLGNGLRVLLFPDQSKPTITVNITYLVGSRHEGYGETGMAHLLEHLLFKDTPKNPDLAKEFSSRGMRFNGT